MLNIAVIEDNDELRETMLEALSGMGHRAIGLDSAEALVDQAAGSALDLLLVDINLPGEDGLSLTRRLRAVQPDAGIIIVTGRGGAADRALSFGSGADIYLAKPVSAEELTAAVTTLSRRLLGSTGSETLRLDLQRLQLSGPGGSARLTRAEATLLAAFARAPDQSLETWQILEIFDQLGRAFNRGNLSVTVFRLAAHLKAAGAAPQPIKAIRNWGYRLIEPLSLVG